MSWLYSNHTTFIEAWWPYSLRVVRKTGTRWRLSPSQHSALSLAVSTKFQGGDSRSMVPPPLKAIPSFPTMLTRFLWLASVPDQQALLSRGQGTQFPTLLLNHLLS